MLARRLLLVGIVAAVNSHDVLLKVPPSLFQSMLSHFPQQRPATPVPSYVVLRKVLEHRRRGSRASSPPWRRSSSRENTATSSSVISSRWSVPLSWDKPPTSTALQAPPLPAPPLTMSTALQCPPLMPPPAVDAIVALPTIALIPLTPRIPLLPEQLEPLPSEIVQSLARQLPIDIDTARAAATTKRGRGPVVQLKRDKAPAAVPVVHLKRRRPAPLVLGSLV